VSGPRRGRKPTPRVDVDESVVMTLQEVADYLNCSYSTALRLARQGIIPGFKLGSDWRFLKSEIDQWIAKGGRRR
jgi:excisionase family DNA binding protein